MVAIRSRFVESNTETARPTLHVRGVRRVVTVPSASTRTAGWPVPPPYVMNSELASSAEEQVLFADWTDPPWASGRISPAEESLRFRQLNFCAHRLSQLYKEAARSWSPSAHQRYAMWMERYNAVRHLLIDSNLGLVYDLLRRNRFAILDRDEILSEGMLAFLRAVDTFDPWRGFRFSTYACNAMLRAFSRAAGRQSRRRALFGAAYDPSYEMGDGSDALQGEKDVLYSERLREILKSNSAELSLVEREVLAKRYPRLNDEERMTLDGVGDFLAISKERVRQIERVALRKLRRALELDPILKC